MSVLAVFAGMIGSVGAIDPAALVDPLDMISMQALFRYVEDLSAIEAYSGWRNAGSAGERAAFDYISAHMESLENLAAMGMTLEREAVGMFLATEIHDSRLELQIGGEWVEIPADGLRGPYDDAENAPRFDTDGALTDSDPDPISAEGEAVFIQTMAQAFETWSLEGRVVFIAYPVIDHMLISKNTARDTAAAIVNRNPAAVVLVTQYTDVAGQSNGAHAADNSVFNDVKSEYAPPLLHTQIENLAAAGFPDWASLYELGAARVTLDQDLMRPAETGNLIAHIPGADSTRAIILGAHVDSANTPGAMDNGTGLAILMEIARVLDSGQIRPPVDLVLAFFGGEEVGHYGSYHFAHTHGDLLDRAAAMLSVDCLTAPLEGVEAAINLSTWSYGRLGDMRLPWQEALAGAAADRGFDVRPVTHYDVISDNAAFTGFGVPNAVLIYFPDVTGSLHYGGHIHTPYDTAQLAWEEEVIFERMAKIALIAALTAPEDGESWRIIPEPDKRAVVIASHTESIHLSPGVFTDFGAALARAGYDVDVIPYGQAVTAADVVGVEMVIALPTYDYAADGGDETWTVDEIAALVEYVEGGGFLIVANAAHRLQYYNRTRDFNEDWPAMNALAEPFGVAFGEPLPYSRTKVALFGALAESGVPDVDFSKWLQEATFLQGDGENIENWGANGIMMITIALARHGAGAALFLADVSALGANWDSAVNVPFWEFLAQYAYSRHHVPFDSSK